MSKVYSYEMVSYQQYFPDVLPKFYQIMCVSTVCAQSCLKLCDPLGYSPLGSSVHGILQARILQWVAISFSRGSSQTQGSNPHPLCLLHWQADSLPMHHLGNYQIIHFNKYSCIQQLSHFAKKQKHQPLRNWEEFPSSS